MLSPYLLQEADQFSYLFITDKGITYHVYFLDYSYMFADYPGISNNVYSFNIEVMDGDADTSVADERIGLTVVEVLRLFFRRIENVSVYVCDFADERHLARKRKFDFWFWKYTDGTIIKEDGVAMAEGKELLNSLLLHRNNPQYTEIISAFKDLNARAWDK
ncbi:MAG: DUF6169 family protein [Chitinophagaceae bacterium]|nr:DUF6169 family protein [Chitinophagaceae bacterium]